MECAQALAAQGQWGARNILRLRKVKTPPFILRFCSEQLKSCCLWYQKLEQSICHSSGGRKQTCDTFPAWHQCHSLLENCSSFVPHFSEMRNWKINGSSSCSEGKGSEVPIFRVYCILKSSDTQDIPSSLLNEVGAAPTASAGRAARRELLFPCR